MTKQIKIDRSKWRCGSQNGPGYAHGKGKTMLLNSNGYMCCVGQMCEQLGIHRDSLLGVEVVHQLRGAEQKPLSGTLIGAKNSAGIGNLIGKAYAINDDGEASPLGDTHVRTLAGKEEALIKLFDGVLDIQFVGEYEPIKMPMDNPA